MAIVHCSRLLLLSAAVLVSFLLIPLSAAAATPEFTPANAAAVFAEAREDCMTDNGALWGISLCGPIMFVDPASHRIITNQADTEGKLKKAAPGVYTGQLPPDQPVANTATDWAGVRWTQVVWPLSANEAVRRTLLAHEAFHRVQDHIAPIRRVGNNAHLDALYGRYTMQLEWRALDAALVATTDDEARQRIADALLFRAARYRQFPEAQDAEVALERHEGLAEYTGVMIGNPESAQRLAMAHRDITRHADDPSFVRSFAYATGPSYGLLLDRFAPGWRQQIANGQGLAALLASALKLDLAQMPVDTLTDRAKRYDGPTLLAAETARQHRRDREIARYRALLIDGPVLMLPLEHLQVQFDPRTLLPLGDAGTVYPEILVSDDWGSITVTGGALMTPDWKQLTVAAPETDARNNTLSGNGWTLHLAPGWQIVPAEQDGDFILYRAE